MPPVQLLVNLVVHDGDRVLLTRYDATAADADAGDAEDVRWWLPGAELEPYEHPEAAARDALAAFPGVVAGEPVLAGVQSFRGRRGWHVTFDYAVRANGEPVPSPDGPPSAWFPLDGLPRTKHGAWEREVIDGVMARTA